MFLSEHHGSPGEDGLKQGKPRSRQIRYLAEYVSRGGLRDSKERGSGEGQTEGRVTTCAAGSIEPHCVPCKFTIIPVGKTGGVKSTERNQEPTFTQVCSALLQRLPV